MGNNTKKLAAIVVIFSFVTLLITLPSYSNQEENNYPKLYDEIIRTNSILEESSTETGLYKKDNTYYFKGIVLNNYININNELWRIISIDENKNITLIKDEGITNNKLYKYNEEYTNQNYKDSNIEKELNTYYNNKLSNIPNIIEKEYCINYQDKCLETKTSKISILNPDDLKEHNIISNQFNDESYLVNNNDYWILNNSYDEYMNCALSSYVCKLGSLDNGFVDEEKTIRPIITLSNNTKVIGEGTLDKPYILTE